MLHRPLPAPCRLVVLAAVLLARADGQDHVHRFETVRLDAGFYAEGATFGDLDRDGHQDVIAGPFWWRGPGFEERRELYPPRAFDPKGYSDAFFAFVHDLDGDGFDDVVMVGFPGREASWLENPRGEEGHWKRHVVFEGVDNESPAFTDLTGDGRPELVCMHGGRFGYASPDGKEPHAPWTWHPISADGQGGPFTHGLGVGDVDGDGRKDVLARGGFWTQPPSLEGDPEWPFQAVPFAGRGGAQMLVTDADGDGDADVITSLDAHGYGLAWYAQEVQGGARTFTVHEIMGARREDHPHGVCIGNLHALALSDVDKDGLPDVVTGNRYWAHSGRDVSDQEVPVIAWFRLVREGGSARFEPHLIHGDSGVGTQVVAGDLDGNGWPDVVVANKKGIWIHIHDARPATAEEQAAEAPPPAASEGEGVLPRGKDGRPLNLDFETGDLRDWTANGRAFAGQPIEGDTVFPRRHDMRSRHQGRFWIGTYEPERSDRGSGTLTSSPFEVTHPFATFLVGGGSGFDVGVDLLREDTGEVVYSARGEDREDMRRVLVDLEAHRGKELFIRLVDGSGGGWGHVNFDDFRFHAERPKLEDAAPGGPFHQTRGYSAAEAAARMTVPAGFKVEVVAAEPDLHQPIALAFDEKGRIWVAEAYSYPHRQPEGKGADRILVFADEDQDGRFESRTVFAEGLNLVSGLEVGFGGVWVGAAPYLLFIPDKDRDLRPDGPPEVLLDGFGFQDTHETLNSFIWGPDGWLYGCHGVFTHSRVGAPGTPDRKRVPLNAGVWRFHPTRRAFEVFAWGTSNPWGVDFDDHGQAVVTACVIPHLYHLIQGGRYERQAGRHFDPFVFDDLKTIADHRHYVGPTPHDGNGVSGAAGGGHAHCGCTVYLGGALPPEYRNRVLMGNIHGNRINTDVLARDGSGLVGRHGEDLLLSNDQWFRSIAVKYGPDGSLFLIDWYDRQACHRTLPEIWDRSNGRLYRIAYGEGRERVTDLAALPSAYLVDLQFYGNEWFVRQARRVLQERGPDTEVHEALFAMTAASKTKKTIAPLRLRALWALHATGGLTRERADRLLGDRNEHLRAWTIQLLCEREETARAHVDRFIALAASDPSPLVRLYLAAALQRLPERAAAALARNLLAHGEDAADRNLPLMEWFGIMRLGARDPAAFFDLVAGTPLETVRRSGFRRLAAGDGATLDALVNGLATASDPARAREMLEEMLAGLSGRGEVAPPEAWTQISPRLLAGEDSEVRERALAVAARLGDATAWPALRARVLDVTAPFARREEALEALVRGKDPALVPLLHQVLDDLALRRAAIRALAACEDAATPGLLLARYDALPEGERQDLLATLAARPAYALPFLEAVRGGRLPKDVLGSAPLRRQLGHLGDAQVAAMLGELWGRSAPPAEGKLAAIEAALARWPEDAVDLGDPTRGRAVFARTCMSCHRLFGVGREVGPDLTGSNRKDLRYVLSNVIDPSSEVAKEYQVTTIWMDDGRVVDGIVVAETPETLTVETATERVVVARAEIGRDEDGSPSVRLSPNSMMPDDQLQSLDDGEVRDLLAYLRADAQVPLRADARTLAWLFNGRDLAFWDADPAVWSVEDGEIVGRAREGLARNGFARSHLLLRDFRLVVEVRLEGDRGNSGIQFRSAALPDGDVRGHQADVGPGWWGKVYEEHGRGVVSERSGEAFVRPGDWNTYEIVAVGPRVLTALNGRRCADLDDPRGAREGILALQVHSGGPTEVRFRGFRLTLDPEPVLETAKD